MRLLFGALAVDVVRRAVEWDARAGALDLEADCARLARSELGASFEQKLGGAGSEATVFRTTKGTVVKCGTGANLALEADVLTALTSVPGVVRLLQMAKTDGYVLLELELLEAMTWKECIGSGGCANTRGDPCTVGRDGECFPECRQQWGQGPRFLAAPLTYASARDLLAANIAAFHSVCEAGYAQSDASSGMNTMVTKDREVKLIDFEKGHPLGHWYGSLWCSRDQQTMEQRIAEVTRCLKPDDPFRVSAEALGTTLKQWDGLPSDEEGRPIWKDGDEVAQREAQRVDIAAARQQVDDALQILYRPPFPPRETDDAAGGER